MEDEAVVVRGIAEVVLGVLILGMCFCSFTIIPAGSVGVKDFFGSINPTPLSAGFNLKGPLVSIHKMSIKTMELKETADTPSKEGLSVGLEVSLLYKLDPGKAPEVYRTIGRDYTTVIVEPQLRSAIRDITANYEAKALYSSDRTKIQTDIQQYFEKLTAGRGIIADQVLLRKVALPQALGDSIQTKLTQEQQSLQMKFVLQKEEQEAQRKRIEAQGIADFQKIVTSGISEPLLRWKGIEATEKLAASNNAKIVVIGSGKDGLPLILGQ
jgi:regulator of protease activity HflC (stomatin/prohibitin superfamily)